MSTHKTDKIVRLKRFGEPKGHAGGGAAQQFFSFCINIEDLDRRMGGIFPRKTCELLVVRGTTSFCNNTITNLARWRKCCVECSNVIK